MTRPVIHLSIDPGYNTGLVAWVDGVPCGLCAKTLVFPVHPTKDHWQRMGRAVEKIRHWERQVFDHHGAISSDIRSVAIEAPYPAGVRHMLMTLCMITGSIGGYYMGRDIPVIQVKKTQKDTTIYGKSHIHDPKEAARLIAQSFGITGSEHVCDAVQLGMLAGFHRRGNAEGR